MTHEEQRMATSAAITDAMIAKMASIGRPRKEMDAERHRQAARNVVDAVQREIFYDIEREDTIKTIVAVLATAQELAAEYLEMEQGL